MGEESPHAIARAYHNCYQLLHDIFHASTFTLTSHMKYVMRMMMKKSTPNNLMMSCRSFEIVL